MPMRLSHAVKTIPVAALASVSLLATAPASGSTSQVTIMQDDAQLVVVKDKHRAKVLNDMKSLGADVIKVRVTWRDVAPGPRKKKKPHGFKGDNPKEYPSSHWNQYDAVVNAIVARGMRPFLVIGGPAPRWASGRNSVDRPKAGELKRFAHALGTRYSGSFIRGSAALPRVDIWSVWNEPNLVSWLSPQYSGNRLEAPRIYRGLVNAAHAGLAASGHAGDEFLIGELLPFTRSGQERFRIRPLPFLRELGCVDSHYHPYSGSAAKKHGCDHFKPVPATGFAYHPYTLAGGPDVPTPNGDEATIADLGRVLGALDRLGNANRFQAHRMPIWISEFGFQTTPPDPYATPIKKVPGFLGQSEWLAYRNPRVASYAQYPLWDDPVTGGGAGFQSGLRTHKGKKKPGVYDAFRVPLFVQRRSSSVVEVFGGVRSGKAGQKVTIESRLGNGKFKALFGGNVALNSEGYFDRVLTVSSAAKRKYRFRFPGGKSRTASVHH
jgi:hypothetical protein